MNDVIKPKRKKKQNRRSISISGRVYDRLKTYCDGVDSTLSGFVENRVKQFLEEQDRLKTG